MVLWHTAGHRMQRGLTESPYSGIEVMRAPAGSLAEAPSCRHRQTMLESWHSEPEVLATQSHVSYCLAVT